MAVDRVQSEPLSVQFPLTGNKTEKSYDFASKSPQKSPLSIQYPRFTAVWPDPGPFGTGNY
jgi:hypothetical protein